MITGIFPSEQTLKSLSQNCLLNLLFCLNSTDTFLILFILRTVRQSHNSVNLTVTIAIASSSSNPVPHHHQKFIYKTAMLLLYLRNFQIPQFKVHKFKSFNRVQNYSWNKMDILQWSCLMLQMLSYLKLQNLKELIITKVQCKVI